MTDPRLDDLQCRLEVAFKRNGLTMPRIATADEQEADRLFRLKGLCRLHREISFARLGPRKGGINVLSQWAEFGGHLPRPAPPTFGSAQ